MQTRREKRPDSCWRNRAFVHVESEIVNKVKRGCGGESEESVMNPRD